MESLSESGGYLEDADIATRVHVLVPCLFFISLLTRKKQSELYEIPLGFGFTLLHNLFKSFIVTERVKIL